MSTETLPKPDHQEEARGRIRLLSQPELKSLKGIAYSPQWLSKMVQEGRFPRPLKLSAGPTATNFWPEHEIDQWIEAKAAERREEGQRNVGSSSTG
jgi:predicted DNA-binding transcriptional regulator AlpA